MEFPSNVITVIGTLAGAVLGSWLTSGRARKEKLWDLQRQAYGTILSELALMLPLLEQGEGLISQDQLGFLENKRWDELGDKWIEHLNKARRRFADDYLTLSDEFTAVFEAMEKAIDFDDDTPSSPPEEFDNFAATIRGARAQLMTLARAEVGARRRLRFRSYWPFRK
jgi:type II secretory pathway pseudopilin PulG